MRRRLGGHIMHLSLALFVVIFVCCSLQTHSISIGSLRIPGLQSSTAQSIATPSRGIFPMKHRSGSTAAKGTSESTPADEKDFSVRKMVLRNALGCWGVVQVVSILANAIKRLYPIALQPFQQKDMLPYQWGLYVAWSLYMAYAEGYKAFQLKFSPMVVQRAFAIHEKPTPLSCLLAGPYSMGLFGASRKRMIVSWCITAGVFSLVKVVKMLPYPYRSIVDAGVVVGLSWGTLSIVALAAKALFGGKVEAPGDDEKSNNAATAARTKKE